MSRTVMCRKYGVELEGLDQPPYPGPKGQEIFESVSRRAWEEWQAHQTMLINEKQLNMMEPEARKRASWTSFWPGRSSSKPRAMAEPEG